MTKSAFKAPLLTLPEWSEILIIAITDIMQTVIQNKLPVYIRSKFRIKPDKKLLENIEAFAVLTQYLYTSIKHNTKSSYPTSQNIISFAVLGDVCLLFNKILSIIPIRLI
jgi:hypothetical protein